MLLKPPKIEKYSKFSYLKIPSVPHTSITYFLQKFEYK